MSISYLELLKLSGAEYFFSLLQFFSRLSMIEGNKISDGSENTTKCVRYCYTFSDVNCNFSVLSDVTREKNQVFISEYFHERNYRYEPCNLPAKLSFIS